MSTYLEPRQASPPLPQERGELSRVVIAALRSAAVRPDVPQAVVDAADPYGEDLPLALYVLYELHYQGFAEVDDEREWDRP